MRAAFILLPVLALAACAEPVAEPPKTDECNAAQLQGLVGQSKTVLKTMLLPAGTRVIGPTDPVTADFSPERMNVEIGEDGRISRIACY